MTKDAPGQGTINVAVSRADHALLAEMSARTGLSMGKLLSRIIRRVGALRELEQDMWLSQPYGPSELAVAGSLALRLCADLPPRRRRDAERFLELIRREQLRQLSTGQGAGDAPLS